MLGIYLTHQILVLLAITTSVLHAKKGEVIDFPFHRNNPLKKGGVIEFPFQKKEGRGGTHEMRGTYLHA
jgi:hypothetical protein